MTEILTSEVNTVESLRNDQLNAEDDLEPHEKRFYKILSSQLNSIQYSPKRETILRILNYSKSKSIFSR